jgi:cephalosporin hydroxylase
MKDDFEKERKENIKNLSENENLKLISTKWIESVSKFNYSYNFDWLGRPIIQFPQDIIALQEIIWNVKPDLVIETGIAHGGSIIFYASLLELIGKNGLVIGIDNDIREHNRVEIEKHSMYKRIKMIEGSSIDKKVVDKVYEQAKDKKNVMVILDSNHDHEHVLNELNLYSSLVTKGSYLVVLDTVIEDMPENFFKNRPWGKGNNPKTAVWEFLKRTDRFEIDKEIEDKLLITVAPDGYLKCVKD